MSNVKIPAINSQLVIILNNANAAKLEELKLPSVIDSSYIKKINSFIFLGVKGIDFNPGTFREPSSLKNDINISSRELSNGETIYSMRSYMDEAALNRFDKTLSNIDIKDLSTQSTDEFTKSISEIYSNLDYTHPFIDTNSRTFRTFTKIVGKESGFNLDWEKIAHSSFLRDELYCARSLSVNKLALNDPAQKQFSEYINNMIEDLEDKKDLKDLLSEQQIVKPFAALDLKAEFCDWFNIAKGNLNSFNELSLKGLDDLSIKHPKYNKQFSLCKNLIIDGIKRFPSEDKAYCYITHILIPSVFDSLLKGKAIPDAKELQTSLNKYQQQQAKIFPLENCISTKNTSRER